GTAHNFIKAQAKQPRDRLLFGNLLAIALLTRISGDRLLRLARECAIRGKLEAQRGRETFTLSTAWLAINNHLDHAAGATHRVEAADFFVDVLALRRVRRAKDEQKLRGFKRRDRLLGQRVTG